MGEESAVDRLIALSGTEHVSGYSRRSSTGKTVHVDAYFRSPGDMSNAELTEAFKHFPWDDKTTTYTQKSNQYQQVTSEYRKRGLMHVVKGGVPDHLNPDHPSWDGNLPKAAAKVPEPPKATGHILTAPDGKTQYEAMEEGGKYFWASDFGDSSAGLGESGFDSPEAALESARKDMDREFGPGSGAKATLEAPGGVSDEDSPELIALREALAKQKASSHKAVVNAVQQIADTSEGKRGASISDVAYHAATHNVRAKAMIEAAVKDGLIERRGTGTKNLFPKSSSQDTPQGVSVDSKVTLGQAKSGSLVYTVVSINGASAVIADSNGTRRSVKVDRLNKVGG